MASVFPLSPRKDLKDIGSDIFQVLWILALVLGVAGAFAVLWMSSSAKDFAVIAAVILGLAGAFVFGRPRLCFLWGLMLTIPLTVSKRFGPMYIGKPGGEDSFRIEVSDLFLAGLVVLLAWEILSGRRKGFRIPKVTFIWMALIGIGCLWVVGGPFPTAAAHEVVRMFKVMVLFLLIANEVDRPNLVWHCAAGLTLGAVGEGVIGLIQYWMKGLIGLESLGETSSTTIDVLSATSVQGGAVFRPSALLQHANLFGIFLAIAIPIAVGMLMVSKRGLSRTYFFLVLAVTMPAEVVALSRSSWVAAAIGVVLLLSFMLLHPGLRWRSLVTSGVASVVGIAVLVAMFGPITQRLLNSKDDATVAREIYKADARRMIDAAPWLGLGLNSYIFQLPSYSSMRMSSYGDQPPAVHNIFYMWWAETGLVGLLLFCAVWGSIIWTGFTNLTVKNELLFVANAACLAGMIALIPDSFLSFTLRVNTMLRVFWLLAGIIMAIRYQRLGERAARFSPVPVQAEVVVESPLP